MLPQRQQQVQQLKQQQQNNMSGMGGMSGMSGMLSGTRTGPSGDGLLFQDNVSFLELQDGTDFLLLQN